MSDFDQPPSWNAASEPEEPTGAPTPPPAAPDAGMPDFTPIGEVPPTMPPAAPAWGTRPNAPNVPNVPPAPGVPSWDAPPPPGTPPAGDPTVPTAPSFTAPPSGQVPPASNAGPTWPTWPPTAPQPGGWGPGWGAAGWPPPQQPQQGPAKSKRVAAAVAAVALVLASAGIGAGVAIAVRGNNKSQQQSSSSFPSFPGFGNGNGSGNGSNGSGNGSNGSGSSNSGPLNTNAIAAKVDGALVDINTTLGQAGRAAGTGMVISSDGYVLTNNHVIADATSISVTTNGGTGSTHSAKVIGYDVQDDVALVKIDGVSGLPTVTFGDATKLNVGDPVVAIGNALGKGGTPTATQGKVTALNQEVTAGDPGGLSETLHGMIQIDAPIQPGDSGGALVNSNGDVVGMNTAAASNAFGQQLGSNVGFSIPVNNAVTITRQIQSGNESDKIHIGDRALLGVDVQDAGSGQGGFFGGSSTPATSGAQVTTVQPNSAASDAGIQTGDVITAVDGTAITGQNALHLALVKYHPGDKVTITWVDSSGNTHNQTVTLKVGPPA
jgi:S1-C subfamily serine protease